MRHPGEPLGLDADEDDRAVVEGLDRGGRVSTGIDAIDDVREVHTQRRNDGEDRRGTDTDLCDPLTICITDEPGRHAEGRERDGGGEDHRRTGATWTSGDVPDGEEGTKVAFAAGAGEQR